MTISKNEDYFPRKCSRWISCSVNRCPLDPLNDRRYIVSDDPERTCKEDPQRRVEIAAEAKKEGIAIPGGGLTLSEQESGNTLDQLSAAWSLKQLGKMEKLQKARNSRKPLPTPATEMVQGYTGQRNAIDEHLTTGVEAEIAPSVPMASMSQKDFPKKAQ